MAANDNDSDTVPLVYGLFCLFLFCFISSLFVKIALVYFGSDLSIRVLEDQKINK